MLGLCNYRCILCESNSEEQRRRLALRGLEKHQIRERLASQMRAREKLALILRSVEQAGFGRVWRYGARGVLDDSPAIELLRSILTDCEKLSADCARSVMRSLGVDRSVMEETVMIIRATKDHWADRPTDPVLMTVLDADVAILGADTSCYETYSRSVRAEFQLVPVD